MAAELAGGDSAEAAVCRDLPADLAAGEAWLAPLAVSVVVVECRVRVAVGIHGLVGCQGGLVHRSAALLHSAVLVVVERGRVQVRAIDLRCSLEVVPISDRVQGWGRVPRPCRQLGPGPELALGKGLDRELELELARVLVQDWGVPCAREFHSSLPDYRV